ncbi:AraC family transcriptional regulator [Eubacterium barkeri]|uniref:Transcriptional regulator, AraC family n=1 Tax=Eubacterium barkeri TaxID=1528 RepID=A0A1H3BSV3_EUBBA|nr:AraC family transcriptional regulator [Eubacterium barkeri]SDX44781.1 transcriptional regulator, AraC family [Eubacterium barkeri]
MEYLEAFERAIIYMEAHLDEGISVHEVAKASGYSYYHFTRIFQSVLGESVGNYLQKRRLSSAAQKLLYSDCKIIDIAVDSGFDSSESFSRAFKSNYQVSPSAYRSNRLDVFRGNKKEIDRDFLHHISSKITVQPQIRKIDDIYVAGIRGMAVLDHIFALWQQFGEKQGSILNKHPSGRTFGICEYQEDVDAANYGMEFTEVIGMEVTCYDNLPPDIVTKTIPSGKFAVFTHKGSLESILKTYQYIWGTWAMVTTETIDERDDFELYDARFAGRENENSEIDIYIPIK